MLSVTAGFEDLRRLPHLSDGAGESQAGAGPTADSAPRRGAFRTEHGGSLWWTYHKRWKDPPFLMGKINYFDWAMFNSSVRNYQKVPQVTLGFNTKSWIKMVMTSWFKGYLYDFGTPPYLWCFSGIFRLRLGFPMGKWGSKPSAVAYVVEQYISISKAACGCLQFRNCWWGNIWIIMVDFENGGLPKKQVNVTFFLRFHDFFATQINILHKTKWRTGRVFPAKYHNCKWNYWYHPVIKHSNVFNLCL